MDLSIVILGYKMRGLIRTCLRNIQAQSLNCSYEIIVVDNDSNDGTAAMMAKEYPEIKFINLPKNLGYPAGNNAGIKESIGRYIITLNPDITIYNNAFDKMVQYMDAHPEVGIVGPKLLNPNRTLQYTCRKFYKAYTPFLSRTFLGKNKWGKQHMYDFVMGDWDHNSIRPVDWVQGSCLMISRKLMDEIGLKDERFFLYFSDVDWCWECCNAGKQVIYYPEAEIIHYFHRESAGGIWNVLMSKAGRAHIKDWFKYLKKHWGKPNKCAS